MTVQSHRYCELKPVVRVQGMNVVSSPTEALNASFQPHQEHPEQQTISIAITITISTPIAVDDFTCI